MPADKYVDHVIYVNSVVIDLVDEILRRSARDPIIIIQGDHGPAINRPANSWANPTADHLAERSGILNVMHLPASCTDAPDPGMTSVNTFKFVFNSCFGTSLQLLPDETYWSLTNASADFELVFP